MTGINNNGQFSIFIPLPSTPQQENGTETQGSGKTQQTDSVSSFEYVEDGKIIKGSVSIVHTDTGNIFIISLDPSSPQIPPGDGGGDVINPNEWFAPNFAAAFSAVMNEIVKIKMAMANVESQTAIQKGKDIFANSMSNAELTKQIGELQAEKKKLEAIQSFVSAGIAFMQMGAAMKNHTKAQHDADNSKAGKDYAAAKAELNKLHDLDPSGKPLHSAGSGPPPPPDPAAVKLATDKMEAARIQKEEVYSQKLMQYEQKSKYEYDIMQNITKGVFNTIEATIEKDIAQLQAQKELNEAYNRASEQNLQNATKFRDEAHSSIAELLRTFDNIMSKQMQWKSA